MHSYAMYICRDLLPTLTSIEQWPDICIHMQQRRSNSNLNSCSCGTTKYRILSTLLLFCYNMMSLQLRFSKHFTVMCGNFRNLFAQKQAKLSINMLHFQIAILCLSMRYLLRVAGITIYCFSFTITHLPLHSHPHNVK